MLTDSQILTVWVGATRYYLGRMSYAVSDFTETLVQEWPTLPLKTQNLIKRDVEEEFKRDDDLRAKGKTEGLPLGHNCDRHSWESVRKLWPTNPIVKKEC